jgi:hypothetical protein
VTCGDRQEWFVDFVNLDIENLIQSDDVDISKQCGTEA